MTAQVDRAAARLMEQIRAPMGAVNTLGMSVPSGEIIAVYVDPDYWVSMAPLPDTFDGFPVRVQKAARCVAGHRSSH